MGITENTTLLTPPDLVHFTIDAPIGKVIEKKENPPSCCSTLAEKISQASLSCLNSFTGALQSKKFWTCTLMSSSASLIIDGISSQSPTEIIAGVSTLISAVVLGVLMRKDKSSHKPSLAS